MAEGTRRAVTGPMPAMDDYDAQDDVRTLARAHAIRKDPKRHAKAKAHAKMLMAAVDPEGDTVQGKPPKGAKPY